MRHLLSVEHDLDRERIETHGLANGDEVQIGKYRLVFLLGARAGEQA